MITPINILAFIVATLMFSSFVFFIPVAPALGRLIVRLWVCIFFTSANRIAAWLDARCQHETQP